MNKTIYSIWVSLSLFALLLCSCERDGWDEKELYDVKSFKPVSGVQGEGSYGRVFLTWQLPDSVFALNYIDVQWKDAAGKAGHQVFARYLDSVWVSGLEESDYIFQVVSCGEDGEKAASQELRLPVADWKKEPAADIEAFTPMVAENFLFLDWKHPQHVTYAGVKFRLFKGSELVEEAYVKKEDVAEFTFSKLDFTTAYRLEYTSVNIVDSLSPVRIYEFETGLVAPAVPEVNVGDRTDYAHSADIFWTPSADMDSLLVKFTDMNGEKREYRFGSEEGEGKGYLSLLPGGTIQAEVQARGINGTWSLPQVQKIKTRLKEEMVYINDKKVAECLVEKLSVAGGTRNFSFEQLSGIKEVTMKYQIEKIDEVELLVNLEILQITNSYPPSESVAPTVDSFLKLIERLPKIKELRVNKGWPFSAELEKAFENHPKVKFTLN